MRVRHRWIWSIFLACIACVSALLIWLSSLMLESERKALFEVDLRQALWRMDRLMAGILKQEAERPRSAYRPVEYPEVYTKMYQKIQPEEVLAPSPLFKFESDVIQLHFQVDGRHEFSSPQVPEGNVKDIAVPALLSEEQCEINSGRLLRLQEIVDPAAIGLQLDKVPRHNIASQAPQQKRKWIAEEAKRGGSQTRDSQPDRTSLGPFEPFWQGGELIYAREVRAEGESSLQGFLLDWPALKGKLLGEIADLFDHADLTPATETETDRRLFTLPAVLDVSEQSTAAAGFTPALQALGVFWGAALVLMAIGAVVVHRALKFGDRQRRFASLVTHELRSPLTTFRLYSDLLAEGMVSEPERVDEYHRTLQRESDQMARIVENVIAHTRVEEGRAQLHPESTTVGTLVRQLEPNLRKPARQCELELAISTGDAVDATLTTDAEAVGQILLNLVENACKYGRSDHEPAILLKATATPTHVELSVRDYGPGIPRDLAHRAFQPFVRGDEHDAEPTRGLGLGLALSRGLARDLGGTLTLERPSDGGARFVLRLAR